MPRVGATSDRGEGIGLWPHRLALLTTAATFVLILAGGVVTTTGAGMAVPDWPTTFGYNMFLFPWSKMVGGILYEHVHRLLGSLVGALTLTLAALLWAVESRRWVRGLGVAALVAVVIQGVLGGLRVVLGQDALAIVHGGFAHAFLALVAGLALFTSPSWRVPVAVLSAADARFTSGLSLCLAVGLYLQIVLGTLVTHRGAGVAAHIAVAGLVSVGVLLLGFRIGMRRADWPELSRPAATLRALWAIQMILGVGSYVARFHAADVALGPGLSIAFPVAHRLAGGGMLILSGIVALRLCRRTDRVGAALAREPLPRKVSA
jgi:heme a synthase